MKRERTENKLAAIAFIIFDLLFLGKILRLQKKEGNVS